MLAKLFESCQKINLEINLFVLLECLAVLLIIALLILLQKKIVRMIRKESIIDARVKATSARIAQVVAEIEELKETAKKPPEASSQTSDQNRKLETVSGKEEKIPERIQESVLIHSEENEAPLKKTRAMSMEERWADFEKKRAARNSAK